MTKRTILILLMCWSITAWSQPQRVVTLAPHLTEWVYSLNAGDRLLAVSDHSDYPEAAKSLPRVASYNGADISAIVALNPDLILAWQGGNKPQDISRLRSLGFEVFLSSPDAPGDIATEMQQVAELLGTLDQARPLLRQFKLQLETLQQRYATTPPVQAFYYLWQQPLMTVGPNAWANQLLKVCGATTLFADSPVDYPEVSVQQVLRRQPQLLIAATQAGYSSLQAFWAPHREVLSAPLIQADPDKLSRFTLRLLPELTTLCERIHALPAPDRTD